MEIGVLVEKARTNSIAFNKITLMKFASPNSVLTYIVLITKNCLSIISVNFRSVINIKIYISINC